jgi:uncharacterized protein YjbJ (UPF0337 family)
MNATEVKGNQQKETGALKQRFARLTGNEDLYQEGQLQEEFGNSQIRLGKTEKDLFNNIESL